MSLLSSSLLSPTLSNTSCQFYVDVCWEVSGCTTAVLWSAALRICSKQHTASFSSFYQAFSPSISLKFKWCDYTVVLTRLHCGRNTILSYIWSITIKCNPCFPMRMWKCLSVDEILLPRYVNWSLNEEMVPSWLKHTNSVLSNFTQRPTPLETCSK